METSTFPQNLKEARVTPKHPFLKRTEKLQACIQLQFHFQNLRKVSRQQLQTRIKWESAVKR